MALYPLLSSFDGGFRLVGNMGMLTRRTVFLGGIRMVWKEDVLELGAC